jgi:hypothetical protein
MRALFSPFPKPECRGFFLLLLLLPYNLALCDDNPAALSRRELSFSAK